METKGVLGVLNGRPAVSSAFRTTASARAHARSRNTNAYNASPMMGEKSIYNKKVRL